MTTPSGAPVLECRSLTRVFDVSSMWWWSPSKMLRAVDDVSLSVRKGEILAIVGESGCGKTTLSRMLLGLLKPSSGTIVFGNTPIEAMDRLAMARRVQPVFQDP